MSGRAAPRLAGRSSRALALLLLAGCSARALDLPDDAPVGLVPGPAPAPSLPAGPCGFDGRAAPSPVAVVVVGGELDVVNADRSRTAAYVFGKGQPGVAGGVLLAHNSDSLLVSAKDVSQYPSLWSEIALLDRSGHERWAQQLVGQAGAMLGLDGSVVLGGSAIRTQVLSADGGLIAELDNLTPLAAPGSQGWMPVEQADGSWAWWRDGALRPFSHAHTTVLPYFLSGDGDRVLYIGEEGDQAVAVAEGPDGATTLALPVPCVPGSCPVGAGVTFGWLMAYSPDPPDNLPHPIWRGNVTTGEQQMFTVQPPAGLELIDLLFLDTDGSLLCALRDAAGLSGLYRSPDGARWTRIGVAVPDADFVTADSVDGTYAIRGWQHPDVPNWQLVRPADGIDFVYTQNDGWSLLDAQSVCAFRWTPSYVDPALSAPSVTLQLLSVRDQTVVDLGAWTPATAKYAGEVPGRIQLLH